MATVRSPRDFATAMASRTFFELPDVLMPTAMSSGRAVFTMQFDHYEAVPQNISDEIQKKYA